MASTHHVLLRIVSAKDDDEAVREYKNWGRDMKRKPQSSVRDPKKGKTRKVALPSLSTMDLMRTFWEKGTCMIICKGRVRVMSFAAGSSWFVLTWSSTPESANWLVSSRSDHGLMSAFACSGTARFSPCTLGVVTRVLMTSSARDSGRCGGLLVPIYVAKQV